MGEPETEAAPSTRPFSLHKRVRNVGRIKFDPKDEFIWNKSVQSDGKWIGAGEPVDKTTLSTTRLKRLFGLSWVVSTKHPHLPPRSEEKVGTS